MINRGYDLMWVPWLTSASTHGCIHAEFGSDPLEDNEEVQPLLRQCLWGQLKLTTWWR